MLNTAFFILQKMIIHVLVCREHVKDVTNITVLGDNITVVYAADVRNELAA